MGTPVSRVCTICARGGSKGVKGKNLMELGGRPLVAHSIEQARATGLFDLIAVSSDAPQILEASEEYGADLLVDRPKELATDEAAKLPVIQHAVRMAESAIGTEFSTAVDLDVTSPLRVPEDIVGAVELLESRGVSQVITGAPARRSPYFNLVELDVEGYVRLSKPTDPLIVRRQDAPACFDMNASVYVWSREGLFDPIRPFNPDTLLYEMPEERSVDIDSDLDARFVRFLFAERENLIGCQ